MKKKLTRGFTLIELMVVISIGAILIALGTVSYTTAQKKGRDARRQGDMKAIQSGFEQYYSDPDNSNEYGASCVAMAVDPYMPAGLPSDPKPSPWPVYNCQVPNPQTGEGYCVCAQLEAGTGNSGADCAYTAGTKEYFCVSNLQ